jgi:NAD(P)-dependent dehydrogenase (short-subunit alcohol dehydrogenase family)
MSTILITGANRGIGLSLAKAYAARGDNVIATARKPDEAQALTETGAQVFELDVADGASVAAFSNAIGDRAIDLLINNAGIGERAAIGDINDDLFAAVLNVNTIGPVRVIEALTDNVAASEGKTIATISSQMGSIEGTTAGFGLAYRVSKAGVNMALKAAAPVLAEKGITLLTLHPGWVATDMGGDQAPVAPDESAAGLVKVIDGAGPNKELRFLDWQGKTLPW